MAERQHRDELQLTSAVVPYPSAGLQDGSATWNSVAQAALDDWNQYLTNVQFTSNTTTLTPGSPDHINSVFFSPTVFGQTFPTGALAITVRWYSGTTASEADTVVSTAYQWDSYRGDLKPNAHDTDYIFDIRRVLDHEFGHNLGLNHPDLATPPQSVTAIMNSVTSDLDHIELDDIQGVWSIYGQKSVPEPVSVTSTPSNEGTVTGNGNFPLASTQTITATPLSGYSFAQWEDGSTNPSRTITVPVNGGNYVATFAPQGTVWTNVDPTANEGLDNVLFVNGAFFAFGGLGVDTSPDGVTWTTHNPTGAAYNSTAIAYHGGIFVSAGARGLAATSTDGLAWTSRDTSFTNASFASVTYGKGLFVAVGQSSDPNAPTPIMTSPDGITWTLQTQVYSGFSLTSVAYANGVFVAVGTEGNVGAAMTSPDGVVWTLSFVDPVESFGGSLAYGAGEFVASTGNAGSLVTSPDGVNWTVTASLTAYPFFVTYGHGQFFALSFQVGGLDYESTLASSPDGIAWNQIFPFSPVANNPTATVFGDGRFVVVCQNAIYATSVLSTITAPTIPAITSGLSTGGAATLQFNYQITASHTPLAFNAIGLPPGLSVDVQAGAITGTPTQTGTFPVTLYATNDAGSGTATLTVTVTAAPTLQSFDAWVMANNVIGGMSDAPRSDGIPNLLKYLYDIDPTVPLTAAGRTLLPVLKTAGAGTELTLTFPQNKALENVDVTVETSTDLVSWSTPSGSSVDSTGTTNANGDPIMLAHVPVTDADHQFIRLVVTPQ